MKSSRIGFAMANQKYIDMMKGNMRKVDHDECMAAAGISADQGLQDGLDKSTICWVLLLDNIPCCAWGVASFSVLGDIGSPWLLATDRVMEKEAANAVLKMSKFFLDEVLKIHPKLENYIDVRSKIAIKWLRWCGFNFDKAKPYGVENRLFHRFWMVKENRNV